ncbi:MAG: hypothetical protein KAR01_01620 [Desulfocapsa sp.]|nr:hypothetical protein [Desulfocapsa sp.]
MTLLKNNVSISSFFTLSFIVLFFSVLPAFAAELHEGTVTLKASSILPEKILSSKLYTIQETVINDGFTNTYSVSSGNNSFQASSNIALYKLLLEIEAIEAMKKVEESDVFVNALKESGVATVDGLKKLFTDPSNTLENAASGIGSLFARAEESIFNSSPGESEDSRIEQTIGFSNAKREVAFRYKVDVYSENIVLQEHLDRIAWAEYAGGLTLSVATMPLGGVAGITLSVSGTARLLGEVIATTPPAELKLQNREKLGKMGIDSNLASLFIENPHFSPLQQTAFIMALEKIKTAEDKTLPLQAALQVNDRDMARYMTTIMAMFAGYDSKIASIVNFKTVARIFAAIDKKGKVIVMLPADYITWNQRLASGIKTAKNKESTGGEIWTIGTVSATAREKLASAGWQVEEKSAKKIGFKGNKNN